MLKKNILYKIVLLCMLPVILAACSGNDHPEPPTPSTPHDTPTGVSRTVLVYMVATNNLGTGGFDTSDLREMETAVAEGDLQGGRLLVYHAKPQSKVLLEIKSEGNDTLAVYDPDVVSVTMQQMQQVIDDVKRLAPADDYGFVAWGHGTGWLQDGIENPQREGVFYSYGPDGTSNAKNMNMTAFAEVMKDEDFSYIYFDCCYMGSVEVMYELRDCFDYIVASPTEVPADGMPYDRNLKYLFDTTSPLESALVAAAQSTFNSYNDVYHVGECPCTMSVVRTDKLDALAQATLVIYQAADKVYEPSYNYQRFQASARCNYYDMADYVSTISTDAAQLETWKHALDDAVVYKDATSYVWSSFPISTYCGLSTFIMNNSQSSTYKNYHTTSWFADVAGALIKE